MIKTCEKQYSSSWLIVIQKSFRNNQHDSDARGLCAEKASHFKKGVQVGGGDNFTGDDTWCQNPCVAEYLIGKRGFLYSNDVGEGVECYLHFILRL